jgi:hypothetical protein
LDGTLIRTPFAGKRIKAFRRRDGRFPLEDLQGFLQHQPDIEEPFHGEEESEEDEEI